jgi:hypothetical protein
LMTGVKVKVIDGDVVGSRRMDFTYYCIMNWRSTKAGSDIKKVKIRAISD